ncbi:MAG: DUF4442 domain-containing protein [Moraxellaceae bacterium]|nr:DUF4442 domain-containing protein [Moraxellaceae bacterium]
MTTNDLNTETVEKTEVAETAEVVTETVESAKEDVAEKAEQAKENVVGKVEHLKEEVVGKANHLKDEVVGKKDQLQNEIVGKVDQLKVEFIGKKDQLVDLVQAQADILKSKNPLVEAYKLSQKIPNKKVRNKLLTTVFSQIVPFVGTANVVYKEFTPNKVVVSVKNKRSVRNHIGQVHAVCVTLLAETATGFITALNMPSDRVCLIKSCKVDYKKPSKGNVTATATLTDEQVEFIKKTPKGELLIPCTVTDENQEVVEVEMLWVWLPKEELASRRDKTEDKITETDTDKKEK